METITRAQKERLRVSLVILLFNAMVTAILYVIWGNSPTPFLEIGLWLQCVFMGWAFRESWPEGRGNSIAILIGAIVLNGVLLATMLLKIELIIGLIKGVIAIFPFEFMTHHPLYILVISMVGMFLGSAVSAFYPPKDEL